MSQTNCKNCGAALDIWEPECKFCGTKNINLTALDLNSGKPANFIFRMPSNIRIMDKGEQEIYMTILAIPSLENIAITNDETEIYGGSLYTPLARMRTNTSMEMGLKFTTVYREDNVMCELKVGDGKC